jgi:hypothetical protein
MVREGSRISPPTVNTLSNPLYAKSRKRELFAMADSEGHASHRRLAGFTRKAPSAITSRIGASLATVAPSTNRSPTFTPRTLMTAKNA